MSRNLRRVIAGAATGARHSVRVDRPGGGGDGAYELRAAFERLLLRRDLSRRGSRGSFSQEEIDVKVVSVTGVGATNAVISGSVDFTLSSGVTLPRAAARGQPLLGIANLADRGGMWIVLRKDLATTGHFDPNAPLATRGALLKDRRMAVAAINAIPHAYLKIIAKAGGVDPEKEIEVAGMAPPDMVSDPQARRHRRLRRRCATVHSKRRP